MGIRRSEVFSNNFNKHMSQLNTMFSEYAFIVNLDSIKTFEGCNMAMVLGLRNKGYKAQNLFNPPHSPWCSPILNPINATDMFNLQEKFRSRADDEKRR